MGLVRILLALAVVTAHTRPNSYVLGGDLAVEIFYLVSGFLISYIIRRDGVYADLKKFYLNRALRIYPLYFAVAGCALFWHLIRSDAYVADFDRLHGEAKALLLAVNTAVFGQDWVLFLQQTGTRLAFVSDFRSSDPPLWKGLLIPQAWSLGLELSFYVVAPYVVKRVFLTGLLAAASFIGKVIGLGFLGLDHDPWTYRFFPFELWVFLLGALSERFWLPAIRSIGPPEWMIKAAVRTAVLILVAAPFMPGPSISRSTILIVLMAALMPCLFLFQRSRKWDVYIGDLSYPLYICHLAVIMIVGDMIPAVAARWPWVETTAAVAGSIIVAVLLERLVARPVERWRRVIRAREAPIDTIDAGHLRPLQEQVAARPN